MILLYAPADGRLLSCTEFDPQKHDFLIPFATFFDKGTPLLHLQMTLAGVSLYTPTAGVLLHADTAALRFFIAGKRRLALWLHAKSSAPPLLAHGDFLPLANAGAPLREGQLLGRLEPALLRREAPLLSLLTDLPDTGRLQCCAGPLLGGRTPLLTVSRPVIRTLSPPFYKNFD